METLFSIPPDLPAGFTYIPAFISEEEERELISTVQTYPLKNLIFQGFEAKRKVLSFGYDYNFTSRKVKENEEIPAELMPLINKVAKRLNIPSEKFVEVLITEYSPGTVINWHRDGPPFEIIAGISLLSDVTFKLRPYSKSKQGRSSVKSFTVQRRSLYLMENEARNDWEHSTAPARSLRYSITLRTLREQFGEQ
jgi:alkylated DNA repair dioxygenase AlkB